MEAMLKLEGVTQKFGGLVAVADLNIDVYQGEIVGLIGPNGAGKSTTFNVITGVYLPAEGKVFFEGNEITGKPIYEITRRGIDRTFQNIRLFQSLSVLNNVQIGMHGQIKSSLWQAMLNLPGKKKKEQEVIERAMSLLAMTQLASHADDRADSLAYGSQRRLEIVRAMASGAKLLLLDEPAAGMNEQETNELLTFILSLKGRGYTILLIEHDMRLVMSLCDRIYVQNQGRLIASGTPDEIRNNTDVIDAYLGREV